MTDVTALKRQTVLLVLGVAIVDGFFVAMSAMMQGFQQGFFIKIDDNPPSIVIKGAFCTPPRQLTRIAPANGAINLHGLKIRGIKRAE